MAVRFEEEKVRIIGNNDSTISPHLKCWVKQGNTLVVGAIGEGTMLDLQANWESPFEQDSAGSIFQKVGGLAQVKSGNTLKTTLNSTQVWSGNRPFSATISLLFYARSNPQKEVEEPIKELRRMISPEPNANIPVADKDANGDYRLGLGRVPDTVSINIGRNLMWPDCIIESISEPLDSTRDVSGHRLDAVVNLTIQSKQSLSRSDIDKTSL